MRQLVNRHLEDIKIFSGSLGTLHWCWKDVYLIHHFTYCWIFILKIEDILSHYYWLMDFEDIVPVGCNKHESKKNFIIAWWPLCSWYCYTDTDHVYVTDHLKGRNKILTLLLLTIASKIHPFMSSLVWHSHLSWLCYKPILLLVLVSHHLM